jgi:hypothetical protein
MQGPLTWLVCETPWQYTASSLTGLSFIEQPQWQSIVHTLQVKNSEKFLSVFGGHLMYRNIPPSKEGSYIYSSI